MSDQQFRIAAFALLASLLVVTAAPAVVGQTSDTLVVGSQHTTEADFENAKTLDGLTVTSSGNGGVVLGSGSTTIDDFEDGDITVASSAWNGWNGDTGSFTATSTNPISGAYSGKLTTSSNSASVSASRGSDTTGAAKFDVKISEKGSGDISQIYVNDESGNRIGILRFDHDAGIQWYDGSFQTVKSSWSAGTDYAITLDYDFSANTVEIIIDGTSYGSFSFDAPADGWAKIEAFHSTTSSGKTTSLFVDDVASEQKVTSGKYVSSNHSVSNAEEAAINITQASNVSVDATVRTDGGTTLGSDTITTTGNHTISLSDTSSESLETVLDVEVTGDNPQFELADESILFNNEVPDIDNASAAPDGTSINDDDATLSINVSDATFGTAQGETVTLEWYLDGSKVRETTVNSNTTASITVTDLVGGSHDWYVEVSDSYGATATSQTFGFKTTSKLYIYNESAPDSLINDSVTVEVTFFEEGGDQVITRTTSSGVLNMSGLDVGSTFIVRVEADTYHDRTIIIDSLFEQQRVYLLNTTVASVENQFLLNDLSGQFGDGTKLIIQRPLAVNGSTSYQRIVGAEFGVTGHTTALEQGVRYRMLVERDGRQRVVGSYLATDGGAVTLEVGQIRYPKPDESGIGFSATEVTEDGQEYIRVRYNDTEGLTEHLQITIHERGNASNVLESFDQTDVQTVMLKPAVENSETSYVVNVTADRGSSTFSITYPIGGDYRVPIPMDATWLGTIAMVLLTFITALYQSRLATVGSIIVVLVAGTLMLFQFIVIEPMAWWAAAAIAVGGHIRATAGGGGV